MTIKTPIPIGLQLFLSDKVDSPRFQKSNIDQ